MCLFVVVVRVLNLDVSGTFFWTPPRTPPLPPPILPAEASFQVDRSNAHDIAACVQPRDCAGPIRPNELHQAEMDQLRRMILAETKRWKYYDQVKGWWSSFKNMSVLDVGMGQGPVGAVALEYVLRYTGLDPAICIDKPSCTRDRRIKSTRGKTQCLLEQESPECIGLGRTCPKFTACSQVEVDKYKKFPFTGLQMMQAYGPRLELLPGTFETLNGTQFLVRGSYDVVFMHTVTEHLPDLLGVFQGIFDLTLPGQKFFNLHHNFYGFGGHHAWPATVSQFDRNSVGQRDFALWQHLTPGSPAARDHNLNRVRLGDLLAVMDVYFDCHVKVTVLPGVEVLLTPELLANLTRSGFFKRELLIETCKMDCTRRSVPHQPDRLRDRVLHHPALDGSYTPHPLPTSIA